MNLLRPIIQRIPPFQAGDTVTIDLERGDFRIHAVEFLYSTGTSGGATQANMEAEILDIEHKIEGTPQSKFKLSELFQVHHSKPGLAFKEGFFTLHFACPWLNLPPDQDVYAVGGQLVNQLSVKIDGGATSPQLTARVWVEDVAPGNAGVGPIRKWDRRPNWQVSSAGEYPITTLPTDDDYRALYFFEGSDGDITDIEVKRESRPVWEGDRALDFEQFRHWGHKPDQGSFYPLVFDFRNRLEDRLKMSIQTGQNSSRTVSGWTVKPTLANANSFDLILEQTGNPD